MSTPKLPPKKQENGILQIVHDFEFVALNLGSGYTEIRDMNADEKYLYLCSRVKKLKQRGHGGVVLNSDFKNYLERSEDIAQILKVAEYAKSLLLFKSRIPHLRSVYAPCPHPSACSEA